MAIFSPKQFRGAIIFACKLLIIGAATGAFLYLIYNYYPEIDFWFKGFVVFVFLYVIMLLVFASTYRCLRIGTLRYRELVFGYLLTTFITNFVMYFVLSLSAKKLLTPGEIIVMTLAQWGIGIVLYALADRLYDLLYPAREAAVVCSDDRHELSTVRKIGTMKERHEICLVCCESEGFDAIVEKIRPYSSVFVGTIDRELRMELTDYCFENDKRLLVMPTVEDIIFHNAHETFVGDSLVYQCRNKAFSLEQLIVKRVLDIVLSALAIIITSPIMFFSAMIIKLQDGGPILFKQIRYTRNLQQFTMIKFRSMVVDAEKDGAQLTVPGDKRITPFGRFMRRTRIDELPQLFNILHGEMSLVGPRAERIENVDYYCELMPEFRYRMKVKAGLTGYAQIYGKYNTSYEDKLKLDLLYIENCSLLRDLQILFLTVNVLFTPESTEGFQVEKLSDMDPALNCLDEDLSGDSPRQTQESDEPEADSSQGIHGGNVVNFDAKKREKAI